jgi:hypothetical protein
MVEAIPTARPPTHSHPEEQPIAFDKIRHALRKGGRNKAPGNDGIGVAYKENWETVKDDPREVLNRVYFHGTTKVQQKHGLTVCLQSRMVHRSRVDIGP